jgi:hypothetical protein
MAKKVIIDVELDTNDAKKGLDDLEKGVDGVADSVEGLNDEVDEMGDGLKKAGKDGEKGLAGVAKGFKGVGGAIKAAGIGLVIGLFAALKAILEEQQPVLDLVDTTMTAIGLAVTEVSGALKSAWERASEATGGFDAMKTVVVNLLNIAITPLKLGFQAIKAQVLAAQLAWEQSFFGDGDPKRIAELKAGLEEVKNDVIEIAEGVIESGKAIGDNIGEAIGEVVSLAKASGDELKKIDAEAIISQAQRTTALKNNAQIQEAINKGLLEQYDRQAEQLRQIRDDESKSIEERTKANEELGDVLNKQEEVMLKNQRQVVEAARLQLAANKTIENEVALIEARNELKAIEATVEGFRSEQQVNFIALKKEELDLLQTDIDKRQELAEITAETELEKQEIYIAALEERKMLFEELGLIETQGYQETVNALEVAEAEKLKIQEDSIAEQNKLAEKQAKDDLALAQAAAKAKVDTAFATAGSILSIGNSLTELGIGNEKTQKALALAQIAIDTAKGISSAVAGATAAAAATGPGAPFAIGPYIAAGIASVLSGVAAAAAALKKAKGTTAGPTVSLPSAPSIPTPSVPDTTSQQQIPNEQAIFTQQELFGVASEQVGGGAGISQVVVVETDITNVQNQVGVIESGASLG